MRITSAATDLLDIRVWNFLHLEQWWICTYSPHFSWGLRSESEWKCFQFHTGVVGYSKDTPFPHPHHFCWGCSTESTQHWHTVHRSSDSHLECVLCPQSVHAGWVFWSFRVSQGTASAAIPPRTTGNTKHSCYSSYNTSVSTLTLELERR